MRGLIIIFMLLLPSAAAAQPLLPHADDGKAPRVTLRDFVYRTAPADTGSWVTPFQKKPGLALLSSALIPGAGQAANKKWMRAGAYLLAEAALLTIHFTQLHEARKQQRRYRQFADDNWSVVSYARWLVNYYDSNGLTGPHIDELRSQVQGLDPAYSPESDWQAVDLEVLHNVEKNTPFIYSDGSIGNNFSHLLPDYGSQQYYELISKYYQFGPGWRDFGTDSGGQSLDDAYRLSWDGSDMSSNFFRGSGLARNFNGHYRLAGNMVSLLILNHIVSAFDAFLEVKIKNNRLKAEANVLRPNSFSLKYHF